MDATLTVGAATETVEVTATAANLQTESATVQNNVTRQQIDALELNGRNPIFMANLVPGTRGGNLSGLSFGMSQGPSNINGARTQESLITYDGAPAVRTRSNGSAIGAADVDSTQEIQILTADYLPEYGRSSGGQIRIITRSGTQQFHGAAYDYIRNDAFNANTWTRNHTAGQSGSPAPINYNQFGYNVGGPFYIPGKFNSDKIEGVLVLGPGVGALPVYGYSEPARAHAADAAGQFQRTAGSEQLLLREGRSRSRTRRPAIRFPATSFRKGQLSPNGLGILNVLPLPNQATPLNGNQNWYSGREPPAAPAQGHAGGGFQPDGHASACSSGATITRSGSISRWTAAPTKRRSSSTGRTRPTRSTTSGRSRRTRSTKFWRRSAWTMSTSRWTRRTSWTGRRAG